MATSSSLSADRELPRLDENHLSFDLEPVDKLAPDQDSPICSVFVAVAVSTRSTSDADAAGSGENSIALTDTTASKELSGKGRRSLEPLEGV